MDGMSRTRRAALVAALAGAVLLLPGCDSGGGGRPGGTSSYDPDRNTQVAGDPDAGIDDIVEAGRATRIGETGTGQVLVSYLVESDDDEGPQASAWRLYDGEGGRVAQGRGVRVSEQSASPDVWSTPDGVLLQPDWARPRWEVVRADGDVVPVTNSRAPTPTRPGDIAIDQLRFYRPSDATTYRYAERRPDDRRAIDITVDAGGGVWALVDWRASTIDVLHSADGGAPWDTTSFELPESGGYPDRVEAVGDTVLVPVIGGDAGDRLVALRHRPVTSTDGPWGSAALEGIDPRGWYGARVTALPDARLVLDDELPWIGTVAGSWRELELPDADATYLGVVGDRVLAATFDGTGLEVSDDLGETWTPWTR